MSAAIHDFKLSADGNEGWTGVCELDELIPFVGARALLGDRQIALFRLDDDRIYAIGSYDPFSDVFVLSRGIVGDLKGEPVVASPIYKHHFSLKTGRCLEKPAVGVPIYKVRLLGRLVQVLSVPI